MHEWSAPSSPADKERVDEDTEHPSPWRRQKGTPPPTESEAENGTGAPSTRMDAILQGLEESMPLIFIAGVCFSLSYIFWGQFAKVGDHYYPLWLMFLILGAVSATGGTVAVLVPSEVEGEVPESTDEYVVVPRAKWDAVRHELEDLRGLTQNLLPEDLVKEAMSEPRSSPPGATASMTDSASRNMSERTRALDLAVRAGGKPEPQEPARVLPQVPRFEVPKPISRTPEPPAASLVPASAPAIIVPPFSSSGRKPEPQEPVRVLPQVPRFEAPKPISRTPEPPTASLVPASAPAIIVPPFSSSGRPLAGQKSMVDLEVDAFRTAYVTAVQRNTGEQPVAFISRAGQTYASSGRSPEPIDIARATCAAVLETYRTLSSRQMLEFSQIVDFDLSKLVQVTKVTRTANESLPDYVTRVRSILEAVAETEVERLPPAKEVAGLQFSLALFRGFLENYIARPYVDRVVAEVEKDVEVGGEDSRVRPGGDELTTYARLLKNSLRPLVGKVVAEAEMESMVRELDAFVEDMRSPPPSPAPTTTPAERAKAATTRMAEIFGNVPGMAQIGAKPTLTEKIHATGVVRPTFVTQPGFTHMKGRPVAPPTQRTRVEWESEAFSAACTTGVARESNEDPGTYVRRATSVSSGRGNAPDATAISQAVSSTLVEAHKSLSSAQMAELGSAIGWNVEKVLTDAGIVRGSGESLMDYVLRARSTLTTGAKAEPTKPLLGNEVAALKWSLAFFKGVLDGYIGRKEAGEIVRAVERDATAPGGPAGGADLNVYSNLVKNALKSLTGTAVKPEDLDTLIREIDSVVHQVGESSATSVPSTPQRETSQEVKATLDRVKKKIAEEEYQEE